MKSIRSAFCCLTLISLISGVFSIPVTASPPGQTGGNPITGPSEMLDIPEEEISQPAPQIHSLLPDRLNAPAETFPVSRVQIEVSSIQDLQILLGSGFACSQLGVCEVEADQAALTTLKELGLGYEIVRQGIAVQMDLEPNSPDALVYRYGVVDNDDPIPDADATYCGWGWVGITISDAPAGALVDSVEYRTRVLHNWPSDLQLLITSQQNTREIVWDFKGGADDGGLDDDPENDDDIYLNHRLVSATFDGEPVNQAWYFDAYDCVQGDTGTIDYYEVWIWYDDGGPALPNLAAYSPSGWDLPIVPSSVTGTNTVGDLYTTSPTYIDLAVINNGSAFSPGFSTCLFMDSSLLNCWTWNDGLQANWYWYISDWVLNLTPSVGWHSLRLEADYYKQVAESNESDNVWRSEYYWNPQVQRTFLTFITTQKTFFDGPFEVEPNNKYTQGNGALISNKVYSGSSNDSDDYFYFITTANGSIQVNLTGHTGKGVQLLLYYQSVGAGVVKQCNKPDDSTSCTINHSGDPGLYYLRIYTGQTPYTNETYSLQAIYP